MTDHNAGARQNQHDPRIAIMPLSAEQRQRIWDEKGWSKALKNNTADNDAMAPAALAEHANSQAQIEPVVDASIDDVEEIEPFEVTHARFNSACALAPLLFRTLQRGQRKREKLDIRYQYAKDKWIEFKGYEPLGADDLRVLQGLVALAGPKGQTLPHEPSGKNDIKLRNKLDTKWDAVDAPAIMIDTTIQELADLVGYGQRGGALYDRIRKSIKRMQSVAIFEETPTHTNGFNLLSSCHGNKSSGRLLVALNPMIAETIVGKGRHARIQMHEIRRLQTESGRLLHSRLCAWIDPGQRRKVSLETLYGYLWADEAPAATRRKRRQRIRDALADIERAGWVIDEYDKGKFIASRPDCC